MTVMPINCNNLVIALDWTVTSNENHCIDCWKSDRINCKYSLQSVKQRIPVEGKPTTVKWQWRNVAIKVFEKSRREQIF